MSSVTPVYGIPYQGRFDLPHGPNLGELMALRVEATIAALEARVAAAEAINATVNYRDTIVTVGSVGSVIFTVPSTLKTVRISTTTRGDVASTATELMVRINSDSTNLYRHDSMFAQNGSTPAGGGATLATSSMRANVIPGASAGAGVYGGGELTIEGWNAPHASHLNMTCQGGYIDSAGNQIIYIGNGVYLGAGPYTTITLLPITGNFITGCGFYLEGLR